MFPLDFEKYLWAKGDENTISMLHEFFERQMPLGQTLHRWVMNDFHAYMLAEDVSQAVCEFTRNVDLEQVDRVKCRTTNLHREDVSGFIKGHETRVYVIFSQIPSQFSKRGKRFKLANPKKSACFRTYEEIFVWFDKAIVINTCSNTAGPIGVLAVSTDYSTLECYLGSTGLLVALAF